MFSPIVARARDGARLDDAQARALADCYDLTLLTEAAAHLRDRGFGPLVTYSRKVFIPLTHLCRDVCHYCTFAQAPRNLTKAFMTVDEVVAVAARGAEMGCKEALFTLGDQPEARYRVAREELERMGFASTLDYLRACAEAVFAQTGLIPHLNPGVMTAEQIAALRPVAASMGIMVESLSERLTEKGMPHYGSPDKQPAARIATLRAAGEAKVPFTTGILIGIGETRAERIDSLLAIRAIHEEFGHIQEIIVQNFRAKPDTKMHAAPEPSLDDLLWTIAVARLIFGPEMSVQAPPNLSPEGLQPIVDAGINDWGGVSPLTPDFVNPEAPWPHLDKLAADTAAAGKHLVERLTVYPHYAQRSEAWVDRKLLKAVLHAVDADGLARTDTWSTGAPGDPPEADLRWLAEDQTASPEVARILAKPFAGEGLSEAEIVTLFQARGPDFGAVAQAADRLRRQVSGETVTYVVNRNINYTNVCYFKCQFCAFSKGKLTENLRGDPYVVPLDEIQRRTVEAWERGATEVCMQGGIHPAYTGQTYLDICRAVKAAVPHMHVHAFSPLEVFQGAETLGRPLQDYLWDLKEAGLDTLPGTAAELLDDEVRRILCPDKLTTQLWLDGMRAAHAVGFKTTATIMYGHVERPEHWARHLLRLRDLQAETGGFTEFVPLPFVAHEAPLYLKGRARPGPTFREAVLMHAVARLALHPHFGSIQTSWVKMGEGGVAAALAAGANDLGGTLMNESITRAAGAVHGEEWPPQQMEHVIRRLGRAPAQRTTDYGTPPETQTRRSRQAAPLSDVVNPLARDYLREDAGEKRALVRPGMR
ncbi:MAG: 5-amino-6-(D-ribitylamino)uracil--L-tyrosine 4-hydroxyphenyl transferase CofH [Alphaproteobacteria bacterium]|nr:5-amino-6-(D-ribitylamino)uracil--L-tyrosine 4-hydroxyphenyl transferase CofH [Alphaproteobacteria bacterium]MCB9930558.1 5-amino-6-(D-ribitylamino)uracil--L-tyrosine 4-hydroxyphenyl transferase CofH [Alphaproteobacteria bacterium]